MSGLALQFLGDFEPGNTGQFWATELTSTAGTTDPTIVTSPVRPGGSVYACGVVCNSVQQRCELIPGKYESSLSVREGTERYYGWSVRVPSSGWATGAWQIMGQFHNNINNGDGWDNTSPPLAIYIGSTNFSMNSTHWYVGGASSNPNSIPFWSLDLGSIPFDTWTDVVLRFKFSTTVGNCLVQAWLNGTQVINQTPPQVLLYPTTNTDRFNYFKIGYYRDPAITSNVTVYYDNIRIGGTYAAVDPSVYSQSDPGRIGYYGY